MTFGPFHLLILAVCTVFFSFKSKTIKDRFFINFAARSDNTALASCYFITNLAFIALGKLVFETSYRVKIAVFDDLLACLFKQPMILSKGLTGQ